jgi:hypothetical protein
MKTTRRSLLAVCLAAIGSLGSGCSAPSSAVEDGEASDAHSCGHGNRPCDPESQPPLPEAGLLDDASQVHDASTALDGGAHDAAATDSASIDAGTPADATTSTSDSGTPAATVKAASCSASDVQAAINAAATGDTILVTGGCTWNSKVTVHAGITLNGQGTTTITFTSPGALVTTADTVATTTVIGFTFLGAYDPVNEPPIVFYTSASPTSKPFRFSHNTLNDNHSRGTIVRIHGLGPGLIDHNGFTSNQGEEVTQVDGDSSSTSWTRDLPAQADMLYYEDNSLLNLDPTYVSSLTNNYYGATTVVRHNTIAFGVVDAHAGNLNYNLSGTRWMEVYANTFVLHSGTSIQSIYSEIRGGSGVWWGNHNQGTPNQGPYPTTVLGPFCPSSDPCSGTWPLPWQAGRGIQVGSTYAYSPFYSWGNDAVMGQHFNCAGKGGICSNDGAYVQVGTAPTDAANCSGHPGNVCDGVEFGPSASTPPVQLKRCQSAADVAAGCPVSYTYAPYVYPHPLAAIAP